MYKEEKKKNFSILWMWFAILGLAAVIAFAFDVQKKYDTKKMEIIHDTVTVVDTVTKIAEIPTIQIKYVYVTKVKIVYDTVLSHDTTVVTKTEIVTFPVDTIKIPCPKKCHYEYERVFRENRYPKHGPLWRIKDSSLECK